MKLKVLPPTLRKNNRYLALDVKVKSVNTLNTKAKDKRVGRYTGLTNRTKKAIVTLAEGQTIDLG